MSDYRFAQADFDVEARHIIEALRSGIPSHAVGQCFTEARPKIMREIQGHLENVCNTAKSTGMMICGKYGEGKTHLLNTVFNMAGENSMVVSYLSLSKETPLDKLYLVYQKLIAGTFLPGRQQPGFTQIFDNMTANSPIASEMITYAAKHLETDKLYYLLRACLNTEDSEERFLLQADLEGDFIANAALKQIYRRIFNQPVKYNVNFSKTKHCRDYFAFMSHLFTRLGYNGWVILIDEGELMGRLSKKARLNAYRNLAEFLQPGTAMESVFSVVAFSASYVEDVIVGKHDYENMEELYPDNQEPMKSIMNLICRTPQLVPLTKDEIRSILERIREIHSQAYHWSPQISLDELENASKLGGYLLRTKIRAAIELLDQMYQYGDTEAVSISKLSNESYEEGVLSPDSVTEMGE